MSESRSEVTPAPIDCAGGCGKRLRSNNRSGLCTACYRRTPEFIARIREYDQARWAQATKDRPKVGCATCGKLLRVANQTGYCKRHAGNSPKSRARANAWRRKDRLEKRAARIVDIKHCACGTELAQQNKFGFCRKCFPSHRYSLYVTPEERIGYLLRVAQLRARTRGRDFSITVADLLPLPIFCPVFPWLRLRYSGFEQREADMATIDRLDSAKGYVPGNVCVTSWRANRMKWDGTAQEWNAIAAFTRRRPNKIQPTTRVYIS